MIGKMIVAEIEQKTNIRVIRLGADQTGAVGDPPCFKIGYSIRLVPRVGHVIR